MSVRKTNVRRTYDSTWDFEVGSDSDKATANLSYKDDFDGWASRVPLLKSAHPDIPGLLLTKIKASREEGGQVKVLLNYESTSADVPGKEPGADPVLRYWSEPSIVDEPLLTFPKIKDFDVAVRKALSIYQNSSRTDEDYAKAAGAVGLSNVEGTKVLNDLRDGQDSWRAVQVVWVCKRQISSLSVLPWNKIGKIDTPSGDPPAVEGTNWMYLVPSFTQSEDGESFDVEERWLRSYEGGWDEYYYSAT